MGDKFNYMRFSMMCIQDNCFVCNTLVNAFMRGLWPMSKRGRGGGRRKHTNKEILQTLQNITMEQRKRKKITSARVSAANQQGRKETHKQTNKQIKETHKQTNKKNTETNKYCNEKKNITSARVAAANEQARKRARSHADMSQPEIRLNQKVLSFKF